MSGAIIVMRPDDIENLVHAAGDALAAGEYVRALALLDQLQAVDGDNAVVRLLRANVLLSMGDNDGALAEAELAAQLAPTDMQAPLLIARAAWRMGATGKAQLAFERVLQTESPEPALLAEYAVFMAWERGPRPAELAAREALAANERSAEAWAALGLAQHRMHRESAADASVKRALQLDPNSAMAQSAMVLLLRARHEDVQAAALVEVMQDDPGNAGFVQAMRKDLKGRKAVKMLLERPEVQEQIFRDPTVAPRRAIFWLSLLLAVGSTAGIGIYLAMLEHSARPVLISAAIAVFLGFRIRSMFYA